MLKHCNATNMMSKYQKVHPLSKRVRIQIANIAGNQTESASRLRILRILQILHPDCEYSEYCKPPGNAVMDNSQKQMRELKRRTEN